MLTRPSCIYLDPIYSQLSLRLGQEPRASWTAWDGAECDDPEDNR